MRKILTVILSIVSCFLIITYLADEVQAATLKFDKTSYAVDISGSVSVGVVVDAGSEQINSTDIYVIYDPLLLEARQVTPGTFFPTVTNNISSGKIYIAGLVDDAASSKTGSGTVATITFRGLAASVASLTFDCQANTYNSSKIIKNDLNATNIIACNQNGTATVVVAGGSSSGGGSSGSGTGSGGSAPLPRSGVFENVVKFAIPGAILFIIGTAAKLLL